MPRSYEYRASLTWTGNTGDGTAARDFGRSCDLRGAGRPDLPGSAPPEFGGDGAGWSPEDLLVASLAQCHMLTYLFVCSRHGVVVEIYEDDATGTLEVRGAGAGRFTEVVLRPRVTISSTDADLARDLHAAAHAGCFVANSVDFPVRVEPTITARRAS